MRVLGVIPARFASTRLPGKPLLDIGGMSMVQRVVQQARNSTALTKVVVATDDQRILDHVQGFGGNAILTSPEHPSGTDRCWEALDVCGVADHDAVVNIQGDEPFIVPAQIDEICRTLSEASGGIATLAQVVDDDGDLDDPGEVLITTDIHGDALYFSRAAIPYLHRPSELPRYRQFRYLKHVGMYAFTSEALRRVVALPPSSLERAESLEQLRWLEHGFKIRVGITTHPSFCVDTQADLAMARERVAKGAF
jgi:3-deoxy-manno-octulosonate cytidylyltransferase (CMP-KDO synthetase)